MRGDQAADRYLRQRVALGHFSPATASNTRYLLASWFRFVEDWEHPTPDELTDWVTRPPSCDAKHRNGSALRAFYRWAQRHRWISEDVVGMVPAVAGSSKAPKPIPDGVLAAAMLAASHRDQQAMVLGRFAGLRASEIAGTHSDHLHDGSLWVLGKGSKERHVPAHPDVARIVAGAGGYVFPSPQGGHVQGQTMSRWLARALPCPWTAHTLRHAFATDLYAQTHNLVLTAEVLGHASTVTTERYVKVQVSKAAGPISAMRLAA